MYGLPQLGILENKLLKERLAGEGYIPTKHTPGLWMHKNDLIRFTLVVDDFGIKYVEKHFIRNKGEEDRKVTNGAILALAQIIKHVMSLVDDAE